MMEDSSSFLDTVSSWGSTAVELLPNVALEDYNSFKKEFDKESINIPFPISTLDIPDKTAKLLRGSK